MVRVNGLMSQSQEGVKTPHRIELCEEKLVRPTRSYRKRRIVTASPVKTENAELTETPLRKLQYQISCFPSSCQS
ncbi:unnamed protein product, partial [Iphiclides podalirius]